MKKSLIALAVFGAFATAASAQSSVTLYGRIDQNVTYQDPGNKVDINGKTAAKLGGSAVKLNDGGVNGYGASRFGLRGTEDLGDGLKAYFILESQIGADTGAAGGTTESSQVSGSSFFNRQAYVALGSKTLGDVRLGRLESLSRELGAQGYTDASSENELKITEAVATGRNLFQNFGTRIDNAFTYKSPVLAGFQGSVIIGLSESGTQVDSDGTTTKNKKIAEYRGLSGKYNFGPFNAAIAYEEYSGGGISGNYNKVVTVGGNYDFGMAVVYGGYQNTSDLDGQSVARTGANKPSGIDVDAFNIGVKVPFGNFTAKAQYTRSTIDFPTGYTGKLVSSVAGKSFGGKTLSGDSLDQDKYGVTIAYALSKRTSVYAVFTERGGDEDYSYGSKRMFAVGVGHNF